MRICLLLAIFAATDSGQICLVQALACFYFRLHPLATMNGSIAGLTDELGEHSLTTRGKSRVLTQPG